MRISDWSSDVCSSDLEYGHAAAVTAHFGAAARRALVEDLGFTGQRVARIDRLEPAQFVDPRRTQPGRSVGLQILDPPPHRPREGVHAASRPPTERFLGGGSVGTLERPGSVIARAIEHFVPPP